MGVKEPQSPEETKHETSSSSFSSEDEEEKYQFKINEKLDVLDRKGQWVDGEVVAVRNFLLFISSVYLSIV